MTMAHPPRLDRRAFAVGGVAASISLATVGSAHASPAAMDGAVKAVLGTTVATPGRVKIDISPLAENGSSMPIKIQVDSPMTSADHVRSIYLFSSENPSADVARFHLGPRAGRAQVQTSMRLANTQVVHAIAMMSDGTAWSGSADVIVTMSACIDAG
jgi:sulfur-oxidizing protein SoxY